MSKNKLPRINNVGIVVESIDEAIEFFSEIGLKLHGEITIEEEWAERVSGLSPQTVEITMMTTPDGQCGVELVKFITPAPISDHRATPVNSLGYLRVMLTVKDLDELIPRLTKKGAKLVGEVVQYQTHRLCYIRASEGFLVGLVEEITDK